ncbi:MAG: type VI secretion system tip protein VgrG [Deltaproteobacteria bacterium]|nr:type VI secretion system tip protein VgrG [Deltaproteobacteria bacterium]
MAYTQENRLIAIDTPLGMDVLLLAGFKGIEDISGLFSFELNLLSENHNIKFEDIIGKNVTVSIILADGDKRFFNGIISRFSQVKGRAEDGKGSYVSHYTATMVPWLWLLKRTADSRIFQKLSVPDIVEKIFTEKGFLDYKLLLNDSYEKRDYCVQYRETDFNFISRLLEEEGICYFFEHEEKKHTLILADASDKFKPCPKQESARYQISAGGWIEEDVITSMEKMQEIRPAKYTINDFNFEIPGTDMKADVSTKQMLGPGEREIYDYPGLYTKKAQGEHLTTIRMEEEETKITTITGSGDCRAFTSGYRFNLSDYYREDMDKKDYVLIHIEHEVNEVADYSGASIENMGSESPYINHFKCIPYDVPYRPSRDTAKPVVRGTQTAIVVGPAGEEIYPDEYGRVKVQFHWDREGTNDENSSCWIRVSQVWAGAGWGVMHIPRIDQEVIVDFLEGDPDRPIITGRVYHGINTPPYPLPDEKTKSTIKSDSSPEGGGSNEIRFEDKKEEEEIYLHGQKDWTIAIENDKNQTVGHDETLSVENNRTKDVGVDQSETIGENKTISVGKDHSETIGGNKTISVEKDHSETISKNATISVGDNLDTTVGKDMSTDVSDNWSTNAGKNGSVQIGESLDIVVDKKLNIQASDTITISSDKEIIFQTGSATMTMKEDGNIVVKGGKTVIKALNDLIMKGSKITEN